MATIDISFIIPVYNCSKYIKRCIHSITALNTPKYSYEIVIVNDGSTDDSIHKVYSFWEENADLRDRILIIETSHGGPGYARNIGLVRAKGTFVWFVDADDEIVTENVETILDQAYAYCLDILTFNIYMVYNDGRYAPYKSISACPNKCFLTGKEFVSNNWDYLGTPWKYIYRRCFLIDNKIEFPVEILHEDEIFSINAFMVCKKMGFSNMYCYKYYKEIGLIMSTMSAKRISSLFKVCEVLYDLYLRLLPIDKEFLSLPLLKRVVLMSQQLLMVYEKINVSYFATMHQKKVINDVMKGLCSSEYWDVIQDTFGSNVVCLIKELERKVVLC